MTLHPQKVNWWYESIVDWMLMNPNKTKADCAKFFNVSNQWLYVLTQSDVFKVLYEERRKKHSAMVSATVIEKTSALTEMVLDKLIERVDKAGDSMTPQFLKDVTEMGLDKLGYGGRAAPAPPQQVAVQVNVVSSAELAEARARMEARGKALAHQKEAIAPPPGSLADRIKDRESITPLEGIILESDPDAT